MRLLRLFGAVVSFSLRRELAHRANLLFQVLMTSIGIVAGVATMAIVYTRTATLAGWTLGEAVVLLGTYEVVSGALQTFVEPNLSWFAGQVREGKLDDVLLQPVPSIVMASFGKCSPLGMSQIVMGVFVVGLGVSEVHASLTASKVLAYVVLLGVAFAVTWASRVLLACVAFWSPYVDPEVLYGAFWQLGRYPVGVYRPPIRFVLTYIIPVAFIATVPAQTLIRGVAPVALVEGLSAALGAVVIARLVWGAGLRRYTSATS